MPILIIGIRYFLSEDGGLCSDDGNIYVGDLESCKDATDMLNMIFGGAVDYPDMPKGCYTLGDKVYFNVQTDRISGSRRNGTHHICKATGNGDTYYIASNLFANYYIINP